MIALFVLTLVWVWIVVVHKVWLIIRLEFVIVVVIVILIAFVHDVGNFAGWVSFVVFEFDSSRFCQINLKGTV